MPMPNCDICGEPAIGVACSTLGPMSFAYCKTCLNDGAEVPSIIAYTIAACGGRDKVGPFVLNLIEPSLRRARITEQEFDRMVAENAKSFGGYDGGEKVQEVQSRRRTDRPPS